VSSPPPLANKYSSQNNDLLTPSQRPEHTQKTTIKRHLQTQTKQAEKGQSNGYKKSAKETKHLNKLLISLSKVFNGQNREISEKWRKDIII